MNEAAGGLRQQLGIDIDPNTMQSARSSLIGDGNGQLDLGALARQMSGTTVSS